MKMNLDADMALARHLTAEIKTEEFISGKGVVVKWERIRKQNHWFDALYNTCAAGHASAIRLVEPQPQPAQARFKLTVMGEEIDPAEWLYGYKKW